MGILVINCGSSSVKFALFDDLDACPLVRGSVEQLGSPAISGHYTLRDSEPAPITFDHGHDHAAALAATFHALKSDSRLEGLAITAVGHRVVQGGQSFSGPVVVGPKELDDIRDLAPLAPVHAVPNALGIEAAIESLPGIPQVAVFDTGFHQTIAPRVYRYAVPESLYKDHQVRRYGFHGTSHEFVAGEACRRLELPLERSRLITAHLGNGCSATAILNGQSVDTSMGLTPLEGLPMGTRSGSIDPNLHSYLQKQTGMSLEDINDLLNHKSGLLGVSGLSNDLRTLAQRLAEGCEAANLAIDIFCFRLAREIAGLTVALQGMPEALIFTGGIGENSPLVRERTVEQLAHFGFQIDPVSNDSHGAGHQGLISPAASSGPPVIVVPTNEELAIAQATQKLVRNP